MQAKTTPAFHIEQNYVSVDVKDANSFFKSNTQTREIFSNDMDVSNRQTSKR